MNNHRKKKVRFSEVEEVIKKHDIPDRPGTPISQYHKSLNNMYPGKAAQEVAFRLENEVKNADRNRSRLDHEKLAERLLIQGNMNHHCSRIYRLTDHSLIMLCMSLSSTTLDEK